MFVKLLERAASTIHGGELMHFKQTFQFISRKINSTSRTLKVTYCTTVIILPDCSVIIII